MSEFSGDIEIPPEMTFRELVEKSEGSNTSDWTLYDFRDEKYPYYCYGCKQVIRDQGYISEELCVHLHKSCAEFPCQIKHPLHSEHHLTLIIGVDRPQRINICNGCRDVCSVDEAAFYCKLCEFYLDFKCALLMDAYFSVHDRQTYEDRKERAEVQHFSHTHSLKLCNNVGKLNKSSCCSCRQKVSGFTYCCFDCGFYIHESCKNQMKEEINHPFHPQHSLRIYAMGKGDIETCRACRRSDIRDVRLSCDDCEFDLHYSCVTKPYPRAIKLKYHNHSLFYFGCESMVYNSTCDICGGKAKGAIFRCVECRFSKKGNFQLECISLPPVVKHESHGCDLMLLDSVKGHESPQYSCDICEERGNSKHHVYSCEDCNFIAHIECVISEVSLQREWSIIYICIYIFN